MAGFRHVLVTTDFSPASESALPLALRLAADHHARLTVLHVAEAEPVSGWFSLRDHDIDEARQQVERAAKQGLLDLRTRFGEGAAETVLLSDANVVDAICRYAREHVVDLIVMATQGRAGISTMLIGSVTERVVRHAPCAVLAVKSSLPG